MSIDMMAAALGRLADAADRTAGSISIAYEAIDNGNETARDASSLFDDMAEALKNVPPATSYFLENYRALVAALKAGDMTVAQVRDGFRELFTLLETWNTAGDMGGAFKGIDQLRNQMLEMLRELENATRKGRP